MHSFATATLTMTSFGRGFEGYDNSGECSLSRKRVESNNCIELRDPLLQGELVLKCMKKRGLIRCRIGTFESIRLDQRSSTRLGP